MKKQKDFKQKSTEKRMNWEDIFIVQLFFFALSLVILISAVLILLGKITGSLSVGVGLIILGVILLLISFIGKNWLRGIKW